MFVRILIAGTLTISMSRCGDAGLDVKPMAKITVYVHWGSTPIPKMKVELIQTGEDKFTDGSGLASFEVPAGDYVVRVFGLNRGGPTFPYVDYPVSVKSSDEQTLDVVDCIPCA